MRNVCVLIVTYNRLQLLKEEIESIRSQSYKDFDILVVNNGSTDGSSEWLADQSDIKVIKQPNLGGAGGFYTGMKYVAERGYEFVWLMDDDVECAPDALEKLIKSALSLPSFGFLCSRVFGTENNLMNVPIVDSRFKNGKYPAWLEMIDDKMIKVVIATFVSLLIPVRNIKKYGLPYKDYFIWGDDSEYTERLSKENDCFLIYESKVIHKRNNQRALSFMSEPNRNRLDMFFYYYRNTYYNIKKYGRIREKALFVIDEIMILSQSLLKWDLHRARVICKALISQFFFSPRIDFPHDITNIN